MTEVDLTIPAILDRTKPAEIVALSELRKALANISTPEEALDVRYRAERMRDAYKIMNKSVEECNQFAEVYLLATWRFGDLVKDIGRGGDGSNQYVKR